jgi:hypothetical protein
MGRPKLIKANPTSIPMVVPTKASLSSKVIKPASKPTPTVKTTPTAPVTPTDSLKVLTTFRGRSALRLQTLQKNRGVSYCEIVRGIVNDYFDIMEQKFRTEHPGDIN